MRPILKAAVPADRRGDITYYNPQPGEAMLMPPKHTASGHSRWQPHQYPFDVTARTCDMDAVKMMIHSVVCDGAHYMCIDIKDYYLNNPLERPEYVRIPYRSYQTRLWTNDLGFVEDGCVLFEINKTMYGLHQSGGKFPKTCSSSALAAH
jgi:hypothetical protein